MSLFRARMSTSQCPVLQSLRTRHTLRHRQLLAYVCTHCHFAHTSYCLRFPRSAHERKSKRAYLRLLADCHVWLPDRCLGKRELEPQQPVPNVFPRPQQHAPNSSLTINSWCQPRKRRRSKQRKRSLSVPQVRLPVPEAFKYMIADLTQISLHICPQPLTPPASRAGSPRATLLQLTTLRQNGAPPTSPRLLPSRQRTTSPRRLRRLGRQAPRRSQRRRRSPRLRM